ncbi:TPA: hypothetical protein ACH3X1_015099 [Trebouxia sp. C0004]
MLAEDLASLDQQQLLPVEAASSDQLTSNPAEAVHHDVATSSLQQSPGPRPLAGVPAQFCTSSEFCTAAHDFKWQAVRSQSGSNKAECVWLLYSGSYGADIGHCWLAGGYADRIGSITVDTLQEVGPALIGACFSLLSVAVLVVFFSLLKFDWKDMEVPDMRQHRGQGS